MNFRSRRATPKCLNPVQADLIGHIKTTGWGLVGILPERNSPPYVFTVGLEHNYEHPELVLFGMPPNLAATILNGLGALIRDGRRFCAGDLSNDLALNSNLMIERVSTRHYEDYLTMAQWFYRGDEFRVLQVIWPDRNRRFPNDPQFEKRFLRDQPLLDR